MKSERSKMNPVIITLIRITFIIAIIWIILPYIRVRSKDINLYKEKSEWIKIDSLEFIEHNRNLSLGSMITLLFKDSITCHYYVLIYYPEFRGQIFTFDTHVRSAYFFINKEDLTRGSLEYPIPVLNYAKLEDLRDQLSVNLYIRNVKKYLRYDKGDKYVAASATKARTKILIFIAISSVGVAIFGMGYYIYHDKKKNKISYKE